MNAAGHVYVCVCVCVCASVFRIKQDMRKCERSSVLVDFWRLNAINPRLDARVALLC